MTTEDIDACLLPDDLYHYTSIGSLALILKHRNIRLSRLDKVDDVSESITDDSVQYAKHLFVSCWTADPRESIPFWHMYTPNMAGVRVKLPRTMFKNYELISDRSRGMVSDFKNCILPIERLHGQNYIVMPEVYDKFHRVEYTDDPTKLRQRLLTKKEDGTNLIAFGSLGRYKRTEWAFQSEWRYCLLILPSVPPPGGSYADPEYLDAFLRETGQVVIGNPCPFDSFFLELNDDAFESMEILLGPKHSAGDRAIVEALIKSHNPKAKLKVSHLTGSLR